MSFLATADHIWTTAHMPVAMRGMRIKDHFDIPSELRECAEDFVETFGDRHVPEGNPTSTYPDDRALIGVGMTLSGPPGRGKTSLACAIATEVAFRYHSTIFFTASADYLAAFFSRHNALVGDEDRLRNQLICSRSIQASLLVLDDMGSEHVAASGSAQKEFTRLIRQRHANARPTIITTNLGPTGWAEAYGAATGDFLNQAAPITLMAGSNLRRGR